MVKTSVFEKYKEYDKKIIELAIETMSSEERMNLKKGYGKNYKGVNVINKHDVASFELVDRKLKRRIEEVFNLLKEGKKENEIKQKYSSSLLSAYTRKVVIPEKVSATTNYKLLPSFLDYFESTPLIQKRVEKILNSISKEDIEIIEYYYIGSKFSALRSYYEQDNEKYQQLQSLIGRLKNEAIKQPKKETAKLVNQSTQIKTTKKETVKTNEPSKKIDDKKSEINKIDENKNPYNLLPSFISYFPSNLIETTKKIMRNFSPKDKQVVGYFYSGVSFNGLRDYNINDEKFTQLNILINKIKIEALKSLKEKENKVVDDIEDSNKDTKSFLDFFEEKDHERVLEIIREFKKKSLGYYDAITKKYSGERFEIVNDVKLTKKEYYDLNNAKSRIKQLLLNPVVENKKEGFLDFFEEKDHEKVLEIVRKFKTTNLTYYNVITKRYSGERFEIINDCKLTQKEHVNLNNAKKRIKQLLSKQLVENKKEYLLDFITAKNHETISEIVNQFKITNPEYYAIITKRYSGERFEIINDCKLTQKEHVILNNARRRINQLLIKPIDENKKEGFLDYFEEKDHERVLEIIREFKITNPRYYAIITKRYSGERFEIINDCKLTQKEHSILNNAKNRIKKIILGKKYNKKGKNLLSFFEEKEYEKVLEIVKQFKTTNPEYYAIITKRYSGERFEIVNEGKPTQKEHSNLTMIRKKIKEMLLKQDVIESTQEKNNKQELPILEDKKSQSNKLVEKTIHIYSIQDILYILPNKPIDNILMNQIIKNRQSILRYISIDEVVDCYIDNLEYFKDEDAITIIKTISIYCPDKITKIINSSYLCDKLKGLTLKEQEYIYLTLRSYSNKFLTKDIISEMLDIDKKELEKYEIMSQYDDVNKLNILLKD